MARASLSQYSSATVSLARFEPCGTLGLTQSMPDDMKIAGPESMAVNMTQFVSDIRGLGAHPIILTPLSRRGFKSDNVTINDTLGPWADGELVRLTRRGALLTLLFSRARCRHSDQYNSAATIGGLDQLLAKNRSGCRSPNEPSSGRQHPSEPWWSRTVRQVSRPSTLFE